MARDPVHDDSVVWREESKPDQAAVDHDVRRGRDGALAVTARSVCPTCLGSTVARVRKVLPGGHKGPPDEDRPQVPTELTVISFLCDCGYPHPDRPTGEQGCGRYWRVTLA
jgi:hypothetical protein